LLLVTVWDKNVKVGIIIIVVVGGGGGGGGVKEKRGGVWRKRRRGAGVAQSVLQVRYGLDGPGFDCRQEHACCSGGTSIVSH
jgi:hypothetical protein